MPLTEEIVEEGRLGKAELGAGRGGRAGGKSEKAFGALGVLRNCLSPS